MWVKIRPLPTLPDGYPTALREAMKRYLQVDAPFQLLTKAQNPTIDFQTHEDGYKKLLDELIVGTSGPFTDRVLAHRWGGWCGTGSDQFHNPQSVALLLALGSDERWAEAAGAALHVWPAGAKGAARLLAGLVPDPESVITGGLALVDLQPDDYSMNHSRIVLLALLLQLPANGRVDSLMELAANAPPSAIPDYARAFGKLVPVAPAQAFSDTWFYGEEMVCWTSGASLDGIAVEPVGAEGQKAALEFICARATAQAPFETARTVADILRAKRQPASIPALKRLLDHPSSDIAQAAAEALEVLGEKLTVPKKLGPVRYALRHNGIPYSNRVINWTVQRGQSSSSSEATTNRDGIMEIPRDNFLHDLTGPIQLVALRSATFATPADPWFSVLLPPPPASDEPVLVAISTTTLRLTWQLPRKLDTTEQMEIVLWGLQDKQNQRTHWSPARMTLPVAESVEFSALGPGTYRAEIRVPGATSWTENLEVGAQATQAIPLARASVVKFTLVPPGQWVPSLFRPELWLDGKQVAADWDAEQTRFHGVPPGAYRLWLPSSAGIRKRIIGLLPDGPDFDETEIPFTIAPDAPAVIDLGKIQIPPK